jgi:aromatic ring-opening dioxygenase catalytic subunit (LigB family)
MSIASLFDTTKPKTPVYFVSHGGPTFMYPDDSFGEPGAYRAVSKVGKFIKNQIKPNFIVVVSAHWEGLNKIEVSVPKDTFGDNLENELIYDFYGFPSHMYKEQFHSKGNVALSKDIKSTLKEHGLNAQLTPRGLDHGVWVPFKVAFSTNKADDEHYWDLDMPLVQVSLQNTADFDTHRKLGQALNKYRELGGVVICSGMSVHNLRDLGAAMGSNKPMPYVTPFNKILSDIVTKTTGDERFKEFETLNSEHKQLYHKAHPTVEHFMPIVVAAGAADSEPAKELYNSAQLSLGWGIYQFGDYTAK